MLDVRTIDLGERAVTLAGVVAVVGWPGVFERLEQILRRDPAPCPMESMQESRRRQEGEFSSGSFQGHQIGRHVVDILIGIDREQILMCLQRIHDNDLGQVTVPRERA